jgi:histidinol phosphatase-like enzyme
MEKAIFFSGCGTSYFFENDIAVQRNLELYPETLPALRFLSRRGYLLVLIAPEVQEYKAFQNSLKDKTITLKYWNGREEDLEALLAEHLLNLQESYFITDGRYLQEYLSFGWQTILVLTGKGVSTLDSLEPRQLEKVCDVCKDFYAAAISIAIHK